MPLPVLSKTWEFDLNIAAATSTADEDDCDTTILAVKNALTNVAFTNPWTVVSSSDSVTADSNDNWANIGDIVHASAPTAHSWIVLEAPVGDLQICFDTGFSSSLPERWGVYISFEDGFTGGTTTNRPTATDELEVSNVSTNIFPTSTFTSKVHCSISDDGEQTRLFVCIAGNVTISLIAGELADTTGLADPTFCHWLPVNDGTSNILDLNDLWNNQTSRFNNSGTNTLFRFTGECIQVGGADVNFQNFTGFAAANVHSGGFHLSPIGAAGSDGTAWSGKLGNIPDLWWGQDVNNTGDQYPASGTLYQFTQFGVFVTPWDSTNPAQVT